MIKAIIFDFDGVIVESVKLKSNAFASIYKPYGLKIMKKVFDIKDILNAVDVISKIDKKKDSSDKDDVLVVNKQVKSNKSEILVLEQMIE